MPLGFRISYRVFVTYQSRPDMEAQLGGGKRRWACKEQRKSYPDSLPYQFL